MLIAEQSEFWGHEMAVDLSVETALIRQAADVLDDASGILAPHRSSGPSRCPLVDGSLGSSALGREVVAAANRRVLQACEATARLADLIDATAVKLRSAATAFEAAESSPVRPHR